MDMPHPLHGASTRHNCRCEHVTAGSGRDPCHDGTLSASHATRVGHKIETTPMGVMYAVRQNHRHFGRRAWQGCAPAARSARCVRWRLPSLLEQHDHGVARNGAVLPQAVHLLMRLGLDVHNAAGGTAQAGAEGGARGGWRATAPLLPWNTRSPCTPCVAPGPLSMPPTALPTERCRARCSGAVACRQAARRAASPGLPRLREPQEQVRCQHGQAGARLRRMPAPTWGVLPAADRGCPEWPLCGATSWAAAYQGAIRGVQASGWAR